MPRLQRDLTTPQSFGAGAHEPYENALRDPDRRLYLRGVSDERHSQLDIERFLSGADDDDAALMRAIQGPVLDIGCGPGRMVKAAILAGHLALGVDVSLTAVEIAQERGLPVLCRSAFHDLPSEGTWGTAMLIDGNIGIGGDPQLLLERCARLVLHDGSGRVLVETHADPAQDRVFEGVVVDDQARTSEPFPWAEVGATALRRYATLAGLALTREWNFHGRGFAEYAPV